MLLCVIFSKRICCEFILTHPTLNQSYSIVIWLEWIARTSWWYIHTFDCGYHVIHVINSKNCLGNGNWNARGARMCLDICTSDFFNLMLWLPFIESMIFIVIRYQIEKNAIDYNHTWILQILSYDWLTECSACFINIIFQTFRFSRYYKQIHCFL